MKEIHPLLNKEKQKQAKQYEKENRILGLASLGLSLFIVLGFFFSGMSYWLAQRFPGQSIILAFLVYFVVFPSILFVLGLPLDYYISYVHEHKWKFSNYTRKAWSWEKAKSFLVSLLIMIMVLALKHTGSALMVLIHIMLTRTIQVQPIRIMNMEPM